MEDKIALICRFGPEALIAKVGIKLAFCLLLVTPSGFSSLGIYFDGSFYVEKPFRVFILRLLSPLSGVGGGVLHYLDDFFVCWSGWVGPL